MLGHRQAIAIIVFSAELLLKNLNFQAATRFRPLHHETVLDNTSCMIDNPAFSFKNTYCLALICTGWRRAHTGFPISPEADNRRGEQIVLKIFHPAGFEPYRLKTGFGQYTAFPM